MINFILGDNMAFGKDLKEALEEQRRTVAWLSRKTGIPKTTLYSIIKRDSNTDLATVASIAAALSLPLSDFIDSWNLEDISSKDDRSGLNNAHEAIETIYDDMIHSDLQILAYVFQCNGKKALTDLLGNLSENDLRLLRLFADFLRSRHSSDDLQGKE